MLFKHYKKEWELMKEWEQKAKELNCVNQKWHLKYTLNELETKFKDKANVLFEIEEINFDYFETCFCKG